MSGGIPTNTPSHVQDHFDKMSALMSEDASIESEPIEELDKELNLPDFKQIQKPMQQIRAYQLTLTHELYKVKFNIRDISVADYQLAIRVPKTDFKFEPQPNSRFLLECMGKQYPVVYLGGLFDFPSDDSWSLTFMMDNNDDTWTQPT